MPGNKVLVVGTTPDYIEWIRNSLPGRVLFLTDPDLRRAAKEPPPPSHEEILCELKDEDAVLTALKAHITRQGVRLTGITAFDCEAMPLAAELAEALDLSYACPDAVENCRDKFRSKQKWEEHGIRCPKAAIIRNPDEAAGFLQTLAGPCILKPRKGSGSELIFICHTEEQCRANFKAVMDGLNLRKNHPLYQDLFQADAMVVAEEFVSGEEFSCDFIMEDGRARVIRICRKLISPDPPTGTARGYLLLGQKPPQINFTALSTALEKGAKALGISRNLCMADFMVCEGNPVFLEMAPRPGGDCLPFLLRKAWGVDMLKLNIDFAGGEKLHWTPGSRIYAGLRIHAEREGILKKIDTTALEKDTRILEIHLTRQPGHTVRLPPIDYDAWLLGHIIIMPDESGDIQNQCNEIFEKIRIEFE